MIDIEETNIGVHALLITKEGKIILQQRDNKAGIVNPGLISIFGGTIKADESLEQGLKRELMEELVINVDNYLVNKLGTFLKTKELDGMDWEINVYTIRGVDLENIKVREGKGFICDSPENLLKSDKLTRITRLALTSYLSK